MMDALVLDASAALAWCFPDEATAATRELQVILERVPAIVPWHWYLEVANAFALSERRQRITAARSAELIELLEAVDLRVEEDGPGRVFSHALPLARTHSLTVYDAVYLDLAMRLRLPLATLDEALRSAAQNVGVPLLGK